MCLLNIVQNFHILNLPIHELPHFGLAFHFKSLEICYEFLLFFIFTLK